MTNRGGALAPTAPDHGAALTAPRLSSRQAARRQHLLDAALALLEARDYERISVREVAESAGVALATLYHYFPSKDHLFAEALVQWASSLGPGVTRRPLAGTTPAQRLEAALLRAARAFERRPQLARLLTRFETSDEPFAHDLIARLDATTSSVYLDLLDDLPRPQALLAVHVLDAVFDGALRSWCAGRSTPTEMRRSISNAVDLVFGQLDSPAPQSERARAR